jgi:hypothetical protein
MTILTLILALLRLAPIVMEMIRDGRIREATEKEVLSAFENEFTKRWQARVDAAVAAGSEVHNDTSGGNDPFDRANQRSGS